MVVHYYNQFFPAAESAGSLRARKLVRLLADRGHRVCVVTGDFNVYDERTETAEQYESPNGGGYRVWRCRAPRLMRASLRARLATYGVFALKACLTGLLLERPTVVLVSIQPLLTGPAALAVARWRGAEFLLEVRDLWPDALEVRQAITGWKLRPLYALANLLYRRAARIVSVTPGIKTELVRKGISPNLIDVFPNGFDPVLFKIEPADIAAVRREYGWRDQFVALYTGTHTEVTAIDVLVRAAAELRAHPRIRFDLFGDGQSKASAVQLARDLELSNIHFHEPVAKQRIPAIIAAADVTLMTLFRSRLIHIYFENKFVDYMGSGKPILAAMEGEQADLIRRYDTGRVVAPFDHVALASLVRQAAADYEPFAAMGERGRRLVNDRLLLTDILDRYVERIEAVARRQGGEMPAWEPRL